MTSMLDTLQKENNSLRIENEKLKADLVSIREKILLTEQRIGEKLTEDRNLEWEKIAQTINHTMKGPNNNIASKITEILNKKEITIQEIQPILRIIEAEARYSNDIINLFDIIRKGTEFRIETLSLSDIIEMIKYSEQRCIALAWNNSSELSKLNLERIIGRELPEDSKGTPLEILPIKSNDKIDLKKLYRVNRTVFKTVTDEFILNMFRHAKSKQKPNSSSDSSIADKPEIFEVDLDQHTRRLQIIFRNTSREPIYKSWQNVLAPDETSPLTKKSFGLYLAKLFSEKHSQKKNIVFYDIDISPKENISEIILTLKEV